MNRAERRAKDTAWRVKQRLRNPPVVPEGWREAIKRIYSVKSSMVIKQDSYNSNRGKANG